MAPHGAASPGAVGAVGARTMARTDIGVVVIGRNEGERLHRCLLSVRGRAAAMVYVDSGSTDGSVSLARSLGAVVHELDADRPFTAARARNAGARTLAAAPIPTALIQFVDGDCEVVPGWLAAASVFLDRRPDVVAVCGRRRERFPERSVYNRLCDIEWDTPVGAAKACGGDVLMRRAAFERAGGFREDLIAGEEPELCVRLRAGGGMVWRLDEEMTLHDADMTRFGQWWKRSVRSGFAFAEGAALHGAAPERHWVRETRSAWSWGLVLPLSLVAASLVLHPVVMLGFLLYPLQVMRLFVRCEGPIGVRFSRAVFLVAGKFAEAAGALKYRGARLVGRRASLIEYK